MVFVSCYCECSDGLSFSLISPVLEKMRRGLSSDWPDLPRTSATRVTPSQVSHHDECERVFVFSFGRFDCFPSFLSIIRSTVAKRVLFVPVGHVLLPFQEVPCSQECEVL